MKTKLLKQVRKEFQLFKIEKIDESDDYERTRWVALGRPKDFFVCYNKTKGYAKYYKDKRYANYYRSLDDAYIDMMREIRQEYSWVRKNSGKYKKIFF
jgi:hypothetical protein